MAVEGMDIHQGKISADFEGKTFLEIINIFKEKRNAIPVGIIRGREVMINPEKEEKLKKNDEVLYIAEEKLSRKNKKRKRMKM
jgi:K+/H+ antiporter YhaU regulatory subunit KhtT